MSSRRSTIVSAMLIATSRFVVALGSPDLPSISGTLTPLPRPRVRAPVAIPTVAVADQAGSEEKGDPAGDELRARLNGVNPENRKGDGDEPERRRGRPDPERRIGGETP